MFRRIKTVEEAWDISQYFNSAKELRNYSKMAYKLLKEAGLLSRRYSVPVRYVARRENINESKNDEETANIVEVDFEQCRAVYQKSAFVNEVERNYPHIYRIAKEQGWHDSLKILCYGSTKKWSREACEEIVSKYTYLKDLVNKESKVYQVIKRYHWDDLLVHLKRVQHAPYNYTIEEIKEICSQYNNLLELSKARKDIENYCRRKKIDLLELNGWKKLRIRRICQILNGVKIASFPSISAAARAIGAPRNRMWDYVQSGEPYKGYVWKYEE